MSFKIIHSPHSIGSDDSLSLSAMGIAMIFYFSKSFDDKKAFTDIRAFITEIEKHCQDTDLNIENSVSELLESGIIKFNEE